MTTRLLGLLMGVLLLAGTGCGSAARQATRGGGDPPTKAVSGADRVTSLGSGWVRHRDARGFQLECPASWEVAVTESWVSVHGGNQEGGAMMAPFLLSQPVGAMQFLRQAVARMAGAFPEARIGETRQVSRWPDDVVGRLEFRAGGTPAEALLLCSAAGGSGMVYAILAPQGRLAAQKPTLLRILRSFRWEQPAVQVRAGAGESGPAAAPRLAFVRWQDPVEHGFSCEVPRGWQVAGGLKRNSPLDTVPYADIVSPDRHISIRIGDPGLRGYIQPLPRFGYPEGKLYPLQGNGFLVLARTYRSGPQVAAEYARGRVGAGLQGVRLSTPRDRSDVSGTMNRLMAQHGLPMRDSAGDVMLEGTASGVPMRGYCFAENVIAGGQGGAPYLWSITRLYSCLAPTAEAATAQEVLARVIASFQVDPNWAAGQSRTTMTSVAIARESQAEISRMITSSFEYRSQVQSEASRKWSNATLGQTDVVNPDTGETWKLWGGHNRYWIGGTGRIVGTEGVEPPDVDFRPLEEW